MSRLSKKFLRPDSVDGSKIKLLNDESLRAMNAAGNGAVSFLKVNSGDQPEFLILPIVPSDPTSGSQVSRKSYVDTKAATEAASALSSAQSYTDSAISALVNGAPELLNTLAELAAALGSDENFAVTIANQLSAIDARLDVIEGDALTEGSVLWSKQQSFDHADSIMAQEVIDRNAAISVAQTALEGMIDAEETARSSADQAEQEARVAADDALDARLDVIEGADTVEGSVAKAEKDAKDFAQGLVDAEEASRIASDDALDARIDVLETDPVTKTYVDGADQDLQDQIDALELSSGSGLADEIAARIAGDEALDARLDVVEGADNVVGSIAKSLKDSKDYTDAAISNIVNGAPALLDTLSELAAALGGDENFSVTVANQIAGLDTRLDVIEGADTVSGSVLWAKKQSFDYTDSEIASEISARTSAIAAEASLRASGDEALDMRLDVIEGDATTEGSILKAKADAESFAQGLVDSEQSARESADSDLDARLDVIEGSGAGSIAAAQAAAISSSNSYTDTAVAAEQSARETADADLQDQLDTHDAEITDLQSQVSSLNSGTFHKEKKVLSAGDISNQYIDLAYAAKAYSTMVFVQGGAGGYMHEGDDFTVSVVGGVTRISFAGDFGTGGTTALDSSDVLYVQYQYVP